MSIYLFFAYINLVNSADTVMELTRHKTVPSVVEMKSESKEPLHAYTAMPSHMLTIMGARRHPAINSPLGNSKDSISIFTSTGFRNLTNEVYRQYVDAAKPDVVIPLADMTYAEGTDSPNSKRRTKPASSKRQLRMVERTEAWIAEFFGRGNSADEVQSKAAHVFAPLLPLTYPAQWDYITELEEDFAKKLSGLAVYDVDILPDLANHGALISLPRLSLDSNTNNPQEILRQIQLGVDIFSIPFLNTISDAGVALSFTFPPPPPEVSSSSSNEGEGNNIRPLGIDMWAPEHEVAVKPLVEGCTCYTCTKHHRAYLHHLLSAREMLGWTLLQIHNCQVLTEFFAGIRASLSNTDAESATTFDRQCDDFARIYDSELPAGTGARPRARGYHFKSRGNDPKMNSPAWEKYGKDDETESDPALAGEIAGLAVTGAAAEGSETPLVPDPDADATDLDKKGFAEIAK